MIQQRKKQIGKYRLSVVICASVLLLLIVGYVVINALISAGVFNSEGTDITENTPLDLREGEASYNGYGVAYPYISSNSIVSVSVKSHKDAFHIERLFDKDTGKYDDYFTLFHESDGQLVPYYPSILDEEPDTDYTDFYAIEGSDGLNAYKLNYLCAAIGALYFGDRIELAEDPEERAVQLNRYGLTAENRETIYIDYLDGNGEEQTHTVFVGDKLITGVGYYFMIKDRDYVYTDLSSGGFEYLLGDFEDFLHSRLVAEGLAQDSLYEPYLTTDYKQWTNTYHNKDGDLVVKDSEVIIVADILTPKYESDGNSNIGDGYDRSGYKVDLIDLSYISGRPEFERLISLIEGAAVGSHKENEIVATVVTNINEAKLGVAYKYTITGIESVLTDTAEYEAEGYPVGDNNLVKVSYTAGIRDGADSENPDAFNPISDEECHAVIDLSAADTIPDDVKSAIRAAKVGDNLNLTYEVTYTEENATVRNMDFVITEINIITTIDENGKIGYSDKITEDSIVTYSYKWLVDGYEIGLDGRATVDLGQVTEGDNLTVKNAILGRGIESGMSLTAYSDTRYCQTFADFMTYRINEIRGFVEKEMIVSFRFANASERDPFYGESIYKNTLENENKFYALNSLSCQTVTYLLGGIGSSTNSQQSVGLVGTETVAVGLTPAVMDEYGLYDGYTVYFELPRGISSTGSGSDGLDDFKYLSTLGFTLYISKEQTDGTRFIASTMYDIVARVDGAQFDYLEKSFEEYWARRNLVMIDYKLINNVDIEIGTDDIYGKYSFRVDHKTVYIKDDIHYEEKPEVGGTEFDELTVTVTPEGEISETVFSKILESEGRESFTLTNLYDRVAGAPTMIQHDTAGAANYKEFLRLMYGVYYVGVMDEAEQEAAFESAPKIFSIAFTLSGSAHSYVYDFYRASDRRVMVHIYRCDPSGNAILGTGEEVSGFYISTFAAKKMINAVTSMLNGENVDVDASYWSEIDGN